MVNTGAGGIIAGVEPDGPAGRAGVRPGERLLAVNGQRVCDLIDYLSLSAAAELQLLLEGGRGRRVVDVKKSEDESLGLAFDAAVFDGIKRCGNHCVFCFVDQMPPGQRGTLYLKDEDYRLSFLQGNYVTLSGLGAAAKRRIISHRLSPLYVSVHAVDPDLRRRLLGTRKPAPILPLLQELTGAGIRIQAQAVICPGWNDGEALAQTISELSRLWPGVQSLAVVPVGLTKHRQGLTELRPFDRAGAAAVLRQVAQQQAACLDRLGTRFVFAADEFYLQAGSMLPPTDDYEDYPQLENGVGLIRSFEDDFRAAWALWRERLTPGRLRVVTGRAAVSMWERLERMFRTARVELEIVPVANHFFGETVTVTGLLTGGDIAAALQGLPACPTFIPRIAVQRGGDLLLDGMTRQDLEAHTGAEVIETEPTVFLAGAARALKHG